MLFKDYESYVAYISNADENELQEIVRQASGEHLATIGIDLSFSLEWFLTKVTKHYVNIENCDSFELVDNIYCLLKDNNIPDFDDKGVYITNYIENTIETYDYKSDLIDVLKDYDLYLENFADNDTLQIENYLGLEKSFRKENPDLYNDIINQAMQIEKVKKSDENYCLKGDFNVYFSGSIIKDYGLLILYK